MSRQVCGNCLCPYGDDGQCACVEDQVMTTERDCKHGQLARSCNVCELESEVARQAAEIERLLIEVKTEQRLSFRDQVGKLETKLDKANAMLRQALSLLESLKVWCSSTLHKEFRKQAIEAEIAAIKQHLEQT